VEESTGFFFRRLSREDLPTLHRWLNDGPVLKWYGKSPQTLAEVTRRYRSRIDGDDPTHVYIGVASRAGERQADIGMLQTYRIEDHPDYARAVGAEPGWGGLVYFY